MVCFVNKEGKNAHQLCRELGLHYPVVYRRLDQGMSIEQAIAETLKYRGRKDLNNAKWFYNGRTVRSYFRNDPNKYLICRKRLSNGEEVETVMKGYLK